MSGPSGGRAARSAADYTAVGHLTVDVLEDGSRRPGGSVFYSALQAARLGLSAAVITRGCERELRELLDPLELPFTLEILPAEHSTTMQTTGIGEHRRQRLLAWAGPIPAELDVRTEILHLAPVARETPSSPTGSWRLLGLTPQGLARDWGGPAGGDVVPARAGRQDGLGARCDALVLSELELADCAELVRDAAAAGGIVAVTAEHRPASLLVAGERVEIAVPAIGEPVEDLGAGDVFAAVLFCELAAGAPARTAARMAAAAASLRVGGRGPDSVAGRAAIEEFARSHGG